MTVMKLARPHKGVVFDLADTLLWGKKGHWAFRAKIYRREGNLPSGIRKEEIFRTVNEIRKRERDRERERELERERKQAQDLADETGESLGSRERDWEPALYWPAVNAAALLALDRRQYKGMGILDLMAVGRKIRKAIQKLHREGYRYPPEVGKLLAALTGAEVPFVLGSNHEAQFVYELLDEDYPALGRWFPSERRYTPESPKVFIHKPNPEFLTRIAERIGQNPSDLVYVGNSPSNDAPMVESGAQVILLDKDDHYRPEIEGSEFQRTYKDALAEHRLIVLRRPKDIADTLIAYYEAEAEEES